MKPPTLWDFVRESNRIEGILRDPRAGEVNAHMEFLDLEAPSVLDLQAFVMEVAGAELRVREGMDVRVGKHRPKPGNPGVRADLGWVLVAAREKRDSPYVVHHFYEKLHPFMDGNGRSGRVLWLWMMKQRGELDRALQLGFLHVWYYQSLERGPSGGDR